jgi:transposase
MHARALERVRKLEQQVEQLEAEKRQLQQQAFGRRSEKAAKTSTDDWLKGLEDQDEAGAARRRGQQAGRSGPGRRDYSHLPACVETIALPPEQCRCERCGKPYAERADTEDAEQIEIEVRAHRRVLRRRRYQPTCSCTGLWRIVTAPAPGQLIPKSRYGVSIWVEILLDKFLSQRPTERLLASWRLLGLDLAAGTVAGGLQRLEPLFVPLYEALIARQQQAGIWQGDETRWQVFVEHEGKVGHGWWLWVFLSVDTVVFVLDASRSHEVPQQHLPQGPETGGPMMVDRYAGYKATAQVKNGQVQLAFCWAHVRRDFIRLGKSWPELKDWALAWLHQIRNVYRLQRQRQLAHVPGTEQPAAVEADRALRQHLDGMHQQALAESGEPSLRQPCRKVLRACEVFALLASGGNGRGLS